MTTILFVEPNAPYRNGIARMLRAGRDDLEVIEDDHPDDAADELESLKDRDVKLDMLITHAYFRCENGDRDFQRAVSLCNRARELWPEVSLIGLTNTVTAIRREVFGFPKDLAHFDIDLRQAEELAEFVRAKLNLSAKEHVKSVENEHASIG